MYVYKPKGGGLIPDDVIGFFQSFQPHCGPSVDTTSKRNEYKQYSLG
jgi:hypothetical protein